MFELFCTVLSAILVAFISSYLVICLPWQHTNHSMYLQHRKLLDKTCEHFFIAQALPETRKSAGSLKKVINIACQNID